MYDKFYVILKGEVAILVPQEKLVMMTDHEFWKFIKKLKTFSEDEIIKRCIESNPSICLVDIEFEILKKSNLLKSGTYYKPTNVNFSNFIPEKKVQAKSNEKKVEAKSNEKKVEAKSNDTKPKIEKELKISVKQYLEKLHPEEKGDKDDLFLERKPYKIWVYSHVVTLKTGDYFGEKAITSISHKRYFS